MDDIQRIIQISKDKSTKHQNDDKLLQPFRYIQQIPDKVITLKIMRALDCWLNIPAEKFCLISEVIEMLRHSSLLIDDIQDSAVLRNGSPVAHSIYGVASTINSANYVYSLALDKIQLLQHPAAITVFIEQMLDLHCGQGIEIYWRDNLKVPTEFDYKLMAMQKLGALFMLSLRLMQLFSANQKDLTQLIVLLGLYFQVLDDYCSLSEDITEGKFSFPVIHAIQKSEKGNPAVLDILKQRTSDSETKNNCIRILEKAGSLKYTKDFLESLSEEVRKEAAHLGNNHIMEKFLDEVFSFNINFVFLENEDS